MANTNLIRAAFETIIAAAEPAWRKATIDHFVRNAENQFAAFMAYIASTEKLGFGKPRPSTRYIICSDTSYRANAWKQGSDAALYTLNIDAARRDGAEEFATIRETFLLRTTEKVEAMVGENLPTISGSIHFQGMLVGDIAIEVQPGSVVRATLSVRSNYRYGANSANGVLTVYSQYPFEVVSAEHNGQKLAACANAVATAFGGQTEEKRMRASDEQKAARLALRTEKKHLDEQRYLLSEAADCLAYIERAKAENNGRSVYSEERMAKISPKFAGAGLAIPATAKEARTERAKVLAARRALPKG